MKFPVVSSTRHKGKKTLEIDSSKETITLVGINGEPMGSLHGIFVDQILTYRKPQQSREGDPSQEFRLNPGQISDARRHAPRKSSRGIGEEDCSLRASPTDRGGTKLVMEFTLPETPNEWLSAKGMIAWVRPKADQYTH